MNEENITRKAEWDRGGRGTDSGSVRRGWKDQRPARDPILFRWLIISKKHWIEPTHLSGYDTGLSALNDITDGLQDEYIIIGGARASIGKTALGNKYLPSACQKGIKTAFFSLEMSDLRCCFGFFQT